MSRKISPSNQQGDALDANVSFDWRAYATRLRDALKPFALNERGYDELRVKMAKSLSEQEREVFQAAVEEARTVVSEVGTAPDGKLVPLSAPRTALIEITDDADEVACTRRVNNFKVRAEPTRDPDFVGEKSIIVSYNGRQEYPMALAPHEARKVYDLIGAEYGFSNDYAAVQPTAAAPSLRDHVAVLIRAMDNAPGGAISIMSASVSNLRVAYNSAAARGFEGLEAEQNLLDAIEQFASDVESLDGHMLPVHFPGVVALRKAYDQGSGEAEGDVLAMLQEARDLLQGAAEPTATAQKASEGMCAQWDVEALALVERIDEGKEDADVLLAEARSLLVDGTEPSATQQKADRGMCAQWDVDALALIGKINQVVPTDQQ